MKRLRLPVVLGLMAIAGALFLACDGERPPPSIVLVTFDTLRADHLDVYGYERPTALNLARLAERGVRFEYGLSQASWTLPALAAIHTSLYPFEHGAVAANSRLGDSSTTVAEVLAAAGYHTIAVVSQVFASRRHGLAQGFSEFDETRAFGGATAVSSEAITEISLRRLGAWSSSGDSGRPFFLWAHYTDPHGYYVRHPEFGFVSPAYEGHLGSVVDDEQLKRLRESDDPIDADVDYARAAYDEEIAFTDSQVGRLIDGIEALERSEGVVFVVTADHGEMFMEHGQFFHGVEAWDSLVRVPLIIGGELPEDERGLVIRAPVETASIPATIAGLAGLAKHPFAGVDLLGVVRGGAAPEVVFARGLSAWGLERRLVAVGYGFKLIHKDRKDWKLFELARDPGEQNNLLASRDPRVVRAKRRLRNALKAYRRDLRRLPRASIESKLELTDGQLRHLESLGYAIPD